MISSNINSHGEGAIREHIRIAMTLTNRADRVSKKIQVTIGNIAKGSMYILNYE